MRVLLWHVHGSWTTAFVQGRHEYLVPALPARGAYGRGRAETWQWPDSAREVDPGAAAQADVDLVILQRPEELALAESWLGGRRPGIDVPAVYVEHNAPQGRINDLRHPCADRDDVTVVHVTHFNALMWDSGRAPAVVIEHGIVDPGYRYTGELARTAAIINEPVRRRRVVGTDLLEPLAKLGPLDLFGIASQDAGGLGNLTQAELHERLPRRRLYVHPFRWTSLGLSLLEAMALGMPVVALATTEACEAVPPSAGLVSNRWDRIASTVTSLLHDHEQAVAAGKAARAAALERYGLARFLDDWDRLMQEVDA